EKKPLNHFYPGTSVLSFGTAGCNLGCKFCQNWSISKSKEVERASQWAEAQQVARAAVELGCHSVAFTYNDPVIWAEYAIDVARACHAKQIKTVAVTAGYISPVARREFFAEMDAANVDLKAFTEDFYQHLTLSHLQPVLDTLLWLKRETDVWFEITNLIIPQANDDDDELRRMCDWIVKHLGTDVPVHFSAFHPDFRLRDRGATPPETLIRAHEIACQAGIQFPFVGNVYDAQRQNTYCPSCGGLLIQRDWYDLGQYHLRGNCCTHCGYSVAGRFGEQPGTWGRKRMAVDIERYGNTGSTVGVSTTQSATSLSQPQRDALLLAASQFVSGTIAGWQTRLSDATLAGVADQQVEGMFLSIKRQGHLRACCGFLGQSHRVVDALRESACTSAARDTRLPPISASELPYLDLQIWLLHGRQVVTAIGQQRAESVVIGRHGLQIVAGQSRGLLLPGVAVDMNLSSVAFLQQVCLKAGLPPHSWKEPEVTLYTFEGTVVEGGFCREALIGGDAEPARLFSNEHVELIRQFTLHNLRALVMGGTPNYYLPNVPDATVQGLVLSVYPEGRAEPLRWYQWSIRPGIPCQATLAQLTQVAARQLADDGARTLRLGGDAVQIAIFYDSALHGTVSDVDLRGMDPARRAILVQEGNRSACVFDPQMSAATIVEAAASSAAVSVPAAARVMSLLAASSDKAVTIATGVDAVAGPETRRPAVAGSFYPGDAEGVRRELDRLLGENTEGAEPARCWPAALVPHAGWRFSGQLAARVMQRVEWPETVIVIGPKHTSAGLPYAVAPCQRWELPGVDVLSDIDMAQRLVRTIRGWQFDAAAHEREHGIEVELPILSRVAPGARVVGVALGPADWEVCQRMGDDLASLLAAHDAPIGLMISSDMNHFATDVENRRLDTMALEALETLEPERLYRVARENHISMCGLVPAVIVMHALRKLGRLQRVERVGYGTSADVTGDTSRVVGYAGLLLGTGT
ncbi:MAG: AmmeMemoRadiSam system radical SAM enzyme, partial [Planctomycetales bacterium]|nr:AmmeMemoRadiSam system radical SAM enzyme [Planctomycetales bacterium]